MAEPTADDIDALVGAATPHFAYQLRARVRELIEELPPDHAVRRYGEEKMELLDRLGHASSLAEDGPPEPRSRIGWEEMPSSAPAADPLPKRYAAPGDSA
jgi:RecB family exonuclease